MNHTGKLSNVLLQIGFALLLFISPIGVTTALADEITDVFGNSAPEGASAYFKLLMPPTRTRTAMPTP
jgi:hypothetical protein